MDVAGGKGELVRCCIGCGRGGRGGVGGVLHEPVGWGVG